MNRRVIAAAWACSFAALVTACANDRSDSSVSAPTTVATTGPSVVSSPVSTAQATAESSGQSNPSKTTPLGADRGRFQSIAKLPGALDLAYRTNDPTLFVATREGRVWAIRNAQVDPAPVLDIAPLIVSGGEQGLLGLTFATGGQHAYVDYTDNEGNTVIAEYAVGADGVFASRSQRPLLTIKQPFPNHNGGSVKIGPDGFLYIGMGDGGAANDPNRRALDTGDLLGKILRIDPTSSNNAPYSMPPDNPFVGVTGARPEIWSIGLRNPWRFDFDRATGDLWIADVGQDKWEEIDVAWADEGGGRGTNFGWSAFEGTHRFNNDQSTSGVTMPIFEYQHGDAGCSISGGVRYRGTAVAALLGWYVYGDYCSGQIRAVQIDDAGRPHKVANKEITLSTDAIGVSAVTQGPDGELYALCVDTGIVLALVAAP